MIRKIGKAIAFGIKYWDVLEEIWDLLSKLDKARKGGISKEERLALYPEFDDIIDAAERARAR